MYFVGVSHKCNSNDYSIGIDAVTPKDYTPQPLHQVGEVNNNVIYYRGYYLRFSDAVRAVLDYIGEPCTIQEWTDDITGAMSLVVSLPARRRWPPDGYTYRVVGSNSAGGQYVANDPPPHKGV